MERMSYADMECWVMVERDERSVWCMSPQTDDDEDFFHMKNVKCNYSTAHIPYRYSVFYTFFFD